MSLKKKFGTDKSAIEEGVWIDIVENEDGTTGRIRIKRMNQQTPSFQKQLANHRKAFESDHFSAAKLTQMQASMIEVLTNTIIVGWENIEDWRVDSDPTSYDFPTGNSPKYMDFTPANVRAALTEFPDLTDLITQEATDISNFKTKVAEAKN